MPRSTPRSTSPEMAAILDLELQYQRFRISRIPEAQHGTSAHAFELGYLAGLSRAAELFATTAVAEAAVLALAVPSADASRH